MIWLGSFSFFVQKIKTL